MPGDRPDAVFVAAHGGEYVLGVLQSVDVADLIAVIRGNRNFQDPETLVVKLDDDFGIEVEVVRHIRERDLIQRVEVICAVAAMEFGEVQPERRIFKDRQDPIAQILVQRLSLIHI